MKNIEFNGEWRLEIIECRMKNSKIILKRLVDLYFAKVGAVFSIAEPKKVLETSGKVKEVCYCIRRFTENESNEMSFVSKSKATMKWHQNLYPYKNFPSSMGIVKSVYSASPVNVSE